MSRLDLASFGEFVRFLREQRSLPLRKVAAHLDIDPSTLGKIERGDRVPNDDLLSIISRFYKQDFSELKSRLISDEFSQKAIQYELGPEVFLNAKEKIEFYHSRNIVQSKIQFEE